eukprot:s183_g13.t1
MDLADFDRRVHAGVLLDGVGDALGASCRPLSNRQHVQLLSLQEPAYIEPASLSAGNDITDIRSDSLVGDRGAVAVDADLEGSGLKQALGGSFVIACRPCDRRRCIVRVLFWCEKPLWNRHLPQTPGPEDFKPETPQVCSNDRADSLQVCASA